MEAAFFAIALRLAGVKLAALAFPPFSPPRRPSVTAAGFFLVAGGGSTLEICPVACWTTEKATKLGS
jgi:hypothetical protein